MRMLKEAHPRWLLLGCLAHALSLLIKDLGDQKQGKCGYVQKVYSAAASMSNLIGDADKVRASLHRHQQQRNGKASAIAVNCPTRFATMHFATKDLYDNRDAIKDVVMDDDDDSDAQWSAISKDLTHAATFENVAKGVVTGRGRPITFNDFNACIDLVNPISDAIHQFERDDPLLSQVLPAWRTLFKHADVWDAANGDKTGGIKVKSIFQSRFDKHYDYSWSAAFLLDPVHATKSEGGVWYLAWDDLSEEKIGHAFQCIKQLAGGAADAAVAAAVEEEFALLRLDPLSDSMAASLPLLTKREQQESGKVLLAKASSRRAWWDRSGRKAFPLIAEAAMRLLSFHVTSCSAERNWSTWGNVCKKARNRLALSRSEMLVTVQCSDREAKSAEAGEEIVLRVMAEEEANELVSDSE